jgi:hypothetical protein
LDAALRALLTFFCQKIFHDGHEWGESYATTDADNAIIMLVAAEWCDNVQLNEEKTINYATEGAPKGPDKLNSRGTWMPVVFNVSSTASKARDNNNRPKEGSSECFTSCMADASAIWYWPLIMLSLPTSAALLLSFLQASATCSVQPPCKT